MTHRPLLITTGEPAGIGMDIILQLASDGTLNHLRHRHHLPPFLVTACPQALQQRQTQLINTLDRKPNWQVINLATVKDWQTQVKDWQTQDFLVLPIATAEPVQPGIINIHNSAMVLEQLRLAHTLASQQKVAGIVTAPLQKSALIDAKLTLPDGTPFSGHTEYFMQMNGIDGINNKVVMMLANQKMKVALVSTHLPLHAVAAAITPEQVHMTAHIVLDSLIHKFGIAKPKILVCGLNPHAGEGGHLGKEEITIINPVLTKLQQQGHDISLAMPADTLFTQRYLQECDAIIAMYHDQGLPVLKSHGFGDSINITLGLPYIRTSVDHGTALDLAGTGQASASSLAQALVSAIDMTTNMTTDINSRYSFNINSNTHVNMNPTETHPMIMTNKPALNPLSTALTAFGDQVFARHASIHIDTDALCHNLQQIKTLSKTAKVLAMVKADAYGHGIDVCLPALTDADAIGVACLAEAMDCRKVGWDKPILLTEGAFSYDEWLLCQNQGMMCVIHQHRQLQWALSWAEVHLLPRMTNASCNDSIANIANHATDDPRPIVWVKYNTGMNRLGFDARQTQVAVAQLYAAGFDVVLMSHFANADSFKRINLNDQHNWISSKSQIQRFNDLLDLLRLTISPNIQASLCNSAGIIRFADQHHDWVRPGILLYGSSPFNDICAESLNVRTVMTFISRIMAVHHLQAGECVGYGSYWTAQHPCHVAVVSVGYGDGYPRVVDKTAYVCVMLPPNMKRPHHQNAKNDTLSIACPIIGRIAMDMMMIDISHLMRYFTDDKQTFVDLSELIGCDVVLWGQPPNAPHPNAPHIDAIATSANTISYELMCRLGLRPTRLTV